jgi:ABC-2 type transport system permease protein
VGLLAHQARFDVLAQIRNPPVVFFGLLLPVIFLLIFAAIFGRAMIPYAGETIPMTAYYVPGIVALGLVSTTYVNLAISLTVQREKGLLKRLRSTPMPPGTFMFGRVLLQIGFSFLITAVLVVIGWVAFGVTVSAAALPEIAFVLVVSAASFAMLGIAMSAFIPNEDSAPAITNVTVLPLYFISGVFFPLTDAPAWMATIAGIFPIRHLAEALLAAFDPAGTGSTIDWVALAIVAGWGVLGLILALRYFRWAPREQS